MVMLACERHLRDLKDGPKRGIFWDPDAAQRVIRFFPDVLRLSEGEYAGKPFVLSPWQQFIVGSLFGWKSADGFRRFRNAYIEIGKGNGKSPLAGGIGIYMMTADGEAHAECYAAATTRDQASILFRDAVNMVDASPALSSRIVKSGGQQIHNLYHPASGSFFRPVSSEGRGLDGKRVHYAALDEIHEHPTPVVVDKMRAGTKGRRQALIVGITNSGFDRDSVCWHMHEYSEHIVERQDENDAWFAYVCQLDKDDQWTDERVWPKANPNLGVSVPLKYLREQVAEAQGMPSKQNVVRRLNFCEWTNQETAAIDAEDWNKCVGFSLAGRDAKVLREEMEQRLEGRTCFIAVDLSSTEDTTCSLKLFPPTDDCDLYIAIPHFWVPEDNVERKVKEARLPYDVWVREGFLLTTPGSVVDYDAVMEQVLKDCERYDVREITFDPWNSTQFSNNLQKEGIAVERLVIFKQTLEFFHEPTKKLLDELIPTRRIAHLANPVLRSHAANLEKKEDVSGNLRPIKNRQRGKVDGMFCLIMALGRANANADGGCVYDDGREIVVV